MTMRVRTLPLWLALSLGAAPVSAEVYKSVDENGNVVFSQTPPKDGKAEVIKPRYAKQPAANAPMTAPIVPPSGQAEKKKEAPPELTPEQIAAKKKNCDLANQKLKELHGPRPNRLQYVNENQELAFLTPELVEQRIKEAEAIVARDCQPAPAE